MEDRFGAAQPMRAETWIDLASLTKPIVTASLCGLLIDRGWIKLSDPARKFLPDAPAGIEIGHLLSHTAGYKAWSPLWQALRDSWAGKPLHEVPIADRKARMDEGVASIVPEHRPGTHCEYSDISFWVLGQCLEVVLQSSLDDAAQGLIFQPLGLSTAHFVLTDRPVAEAWDSRYAATENCAWRGGVLQGQVHDDNCWAMGGVGPHAGLFADALDVLKFAASCLAGGFLSRDTMMTLWTRVSASQPTTRTFGWDTPSNEESSLGSVFSRDAVGHLGFTGTSLWIDLKNQCVVTLLANRVHPSREPNRFKEWRSRLHDALGQDLKSLGWIE